jgi:hypothetical protein
VDLIAIVNPKEKEKKKTLWTKVNEHHRQQIDRNSRTVGNFLPKMN